MDFYDHDGRPLEPGDKVTFLYLKKRHYARIKAICATTIVALLDVVDDTGKTRTLEHTRQSLDSFTFQVQKLEGGMNPTRAHAKAIVRRRLNHLKTELAEARFKRRYARGFNRLLARRSETQLRKTINTAHKHFFDDIQTLQGA